MIEDKIYRPAYEVSHHNYLSYKYTIMYKPFIEGIEFDLYLETHSLSNEEFPTSKLYLKVESELPYTQLIGHVITKSGSLSHQNPFDIVIQPESNIIVYNLPNIPLKRIFVSEHGICPSINEIEIIGYAKKNTGPDKAFNIKLGLPLYDEFWDEKDWIESFGKFWNLSYLNRQFNNYRIRFINKLAGPFAMLEVNKKRNESRVEKIRRLKCLFVINILANEKVLKFIWWLTMKWRINTLKEISKNEIG
ncbi:hypothetical protein A6E11_08410 [Aliivibrio fischeri]|nr:hypothetical protein A6E11_08410 [Aliivibrio fischeri]